MNELLNNPEFQELLPYLPYVYAAMVLQIVLLLLLGNSIRSTMMLIRKENRMMPPWQAFFIAVPLLNIYWNFVVVKNLRDSLINEYFDRQVAVEENPTQKSGYIFAGGYLLGNLPIKGLNYIGSIAYFIGMIMYWVKVVEHKKILKNTINTDIVE